MFSVSDRFSIDDVVSDMKTSGAVCQSGLITAVLHKQPALFASPHLYTRSDFSSSSSRLPPCDRSSWVPSPSVFRLFLIDVP